MKQKIISFGGQNRAGPAKKVRTNAAAGSLKRRRRRRTGRQTLHYLLILLVAMAVLTILSFTVFFKIEKIEVVGNTKYADQQLIAQSGISIGDNLFRISQKNIKKALMEKFPYVEDVKLKRSFPPKLTIQITQEIPLGAVNTQTGYVVIGCSGKVLETGVHTLPENITVVNGMYLSLPEVGHWLGETVETGDLSYSPEVVAEIEAYRKQESDSQKSKKTDKVELEKEWRAKSANTEEEYFKMLTYLVDAVEETGFGKITLADFSDRLNIRIVYDNRILVELGSEADLPYKLRFVQKLIKDKLPEDYKGRLDASTASSSGQVWELACDISDELEKMKPQWQNETPEQTEINPEEKPPNTESASSKPENPDLAVAPQSEPQSSSAASSKTASSSSQEEVSSSENSFAQPDDLAVIPGSGSSNSNDSSSKPAPE